MTSRERILATLNHHQPDRVAVDFAGHRSSGIMAMAYARLRDFLGLPKKPIRVYDPIQQLAIVDDDVLERFQVDTIELGRAFAREDKWWSEWTLPDGTACLMPVWAKPHHAPGEWQLRLKSGRVLGRMPDGVIYFEQTHFPLLEQDEPAHVAEAFEECIWPAFATPPGPIVAGPDGERLLAETARHFRQQTAVRSSACSAATCWRSGNSFTATTISSCCWRANRNARIASSTNCWRFTSPISTASSPPWASTWM